MYVFIETNICFLGLVINPSPCLEHRMCELGNQQAVLCSACHLLYVNVTFCPLSFHLLHPYKAQEVLYECTRLNASIFNCMEQLELCDQKGGVCDCSN